MAFKELGEDPTDDSRLSFVNGPLANAGHDVTVRQPASRHAGQYGITPYLIDTLDAAQHNAMNVLHGGAQLVTHGLAQLPGQVGEYFAGVGAKDDAALRDREAAYQSRTQDNPSSYVGAAAGQVAPWLLGAGALRA